MDSVSVTSSDADSFELVSKPSEPDEDNKPANVKPQDSINCEHVELFSALPFASEDADVTTLTPREFIDCEKGNHRSTRKPYNTAVAYSLEAHVIPYVVVCVIALTYYHVRYGLDSKTYRTTFGTCAYGFTTGYLNTTLLRFYVPMADNWWQAILMCVYAAIIGSSVTFLVYAMFIL